MMWLVGWRAFLLVQVPVITVLATVAVFMFYVQHQFEDVYWARDGEWDYATAALTGSSYFKLPAVLQWFTGNIGLHHIHHLSPRIPNYRLQACHDENPMFQDVPTLTLATSVQCLKLALWDEGGRRLVSFRDARAL
jgi:omega-6 fatty acid desaturase (delta-12 desaturase)